MSEMAQESGEGPSLAEAAATIDRVEQFDEALRQRTEGIVLMVWGTVMAGLFVSYAYAGVLYGDAFPWWANQLWLPWVVLGVVITASLWRSVALAVPRFNETRRHPLLVLVAWLAGISAVWALTLVVSPGLNEPTYWLLGIGSLLTLFGAVNLENRSRPGRRASLAVGAAVLAVAVVLAWQLPSDPVQGYRVATVVATLASGGIPLLGGLWLVARG